MMNELLMYAVYENPRDFPGKFVVRRWCVRDGQIVASPDASTADTLEGARARVPQGYVRTPRYRSDDPAIVEVWV